MSFRKRVRRGLGDDELDDLEFGGLYPRPVLAWGFCDPQATAGAGRDHSGLDGHILSAVGMDLGREREKRARLCDTLYIRAPLAMLRLLTESEEPDA